MPKVSIIIVNFNTCDLTIQCIKSITTSRPKNIYEIIVVDNASEDGSVDVISNLKSQISNLTILTNKENVGFSKANNQGIKKSRGKYVLLLNSDTKVTNDAIDNLISFAEKTPEVGVVGARLLNSDGSVQSSCFNFPTIGRAIKQYWLKRSNLLDKFSPSGNTPMMVDAVVGAAFLITPAAKEKVGLLNEKYFMFYEDIEYCRNVWRAGLKVYYLPSSKVVHYHGSSGKKLVDTNNQWRRLVPSSKIYHGWLKHYIINFIIWSSQKWQKKAS